jgi:hypothetical protein
MTDEERARVFLERLVADPDFRARFDRDPVGTAREAGLHELAEELEHVNGAPIQDIQGRESRSSLAGALAAAAAEGIALFEFAGHAFGADAAYAASGNGAGDHWNAAEFGAQGTGGPVTPETEALLHNPNVSLDASGLSDFQEGKMDPRLVSVLTELSHQHKLVISATISDHSKLTTGGSVSNHYYGRAFDIASIDGQPVNASNEVAKKIALELSQLDPSIRPSEIGSPWALSGPAYFTDAEHQNHLHIGYDDPIQPNWTPPTDDAAAPTPEQAVSSAPPPQAVQNAAALDDNAADDSSEDDSDEEDANDGVGDEASDDPSDDTDDEDEQDEGSDGDGDAPGEGSNGEDANDDDSDDSGDDSPSNPPNPPNPSNPSTPESPDDDDPSNPPNPSTPATPESPDDNAPSTPDAPDAPDTPVDPVPYPGNNATHEQMAAWLANGAKQRGLPPELPVMAALVESGMRNLDYGDADSVGLFQMRASVWNNGAYAGYGHNPELQLKWFLDHAEAVKAQRVAAGLSVDDPRRYGDWIADIERPAEQFRGRYQLRLGEAQALLAQADAAPGSTNISSGNNAQVLPAVQQNP